MKIEHLTIALVVVVILLIISAFYSPEVPEVKKGEPEFIVIEEKEEPEPVIVEFKEKPKEAVIEIKRGFFDPKEITVVEGTKVIWVNMDENAHKIADSSTPRRFYGDRFLPGENYSFTFDNAGEYYYFDAIFYKTMKGKVTVVEDKIPITGGVVAVPAYSDKATGAAILIAITAILSIHLIFYKEKKH